MHEVISPITDQSLSDKLSKEAAQKAGNFVHSKPTADNSIVLLIDQQVGLLASTRAQPLTELRDNILGLAKTAKALKIPTLITSSNAQWQNGDTIPELKALFPDDPIYRRTGIINAYEDSTFRKAFEAIVQKTGRDHIIVSGVTIGTCCTFPTLSLLNDGYRVFPVIDACGAWNELEYSAAIARMSQAGAETETTFALAAELQADWKCPSGAAMLQPFADNLPEYGYITADTNNSVQDPFAK